MKGSRVVLSKVPLGIVSAQLYVHAAVGYTNMGQGKCGVMDAKDFETLL